MKNGEIIEISKPEEANSEGLQIQMLMDFDNTFRGLNIQEINKAGKIAREVFVRKTELSQLIYKLEGIEKKVLAPLNREEILDIMNESSLKEEEKQNEY